MRDLNEIQADLMPMDELLRAAECLKLMAHPARIRIAELLVKQKLAVNTIAACCEIPQNQASEHLRMMQRHGLLISERRGRQVFYKAASIRLFNLTQCLYNTSLQKQPQNTKEG